MRKSLFFLLSILTYGISSAQTIWSGHFNITKIASEQFRVELVLQADPGLQNTLNVGICISDTVTMSPDTMILSLDSNYLHQHKPFLPTVEVSYYSGILDLGGSQDSTWIILKFIQCCRPTNINSFWSDNWAWTENPMFVTIGRILLLPDSIQPIGFSIWMEPIPLWVPVDTLSIINIAKSDTSAFINTWSYYQGKISANGDPCCSIQVVTSTDSCNGLPSVWAYNSLNSILNYSNNNQWSINNNGSAGQIQWNPNQLGNVAMGFLVTREPIASLPSHTFRVYDRSLGVEGSQITQTPIRWEVWDITGRLLYDSDIPPPNIIIFNNRISGDFYLCKTTMSDGSVVWDKIVR